MAKKLKEKTVRTHAIDAIGSQDKDSDIGGDIAKNYNDC